MTLVFNWVPLSFRSESIWFRSKWIETVARARPFTSKSVCGRRLCFVRLYAELPAKNKPNRKWTTDRNAFRVISNECFFSLVILLNAIQIGAQLMNMTFRINTTVHGGALKCEIPLFFCIEPCWRSCRWWDKLTDLDQFDARWFGQSTHTGPRSMRSNDSGSIQQVRNRILRTKDRSQYTAG